MANTFNSIQLFKKNRGTHGGIQELLIKDDLPNSEQQIPEPIIKPLELKDEEISSPRNLGQSPPSSGITKAIREALAILAMDPKDRTFLNSLRDIETVRKWPIWSILRKFQ